MPSDYTIDTEQLLVYSRAWGDVRDEDLFDHQRRLARDPDFHRDFSQLLDFRGADVKAVTAACIRSCAQPHLYGPRSRRAIVVSDLGAFGLARMFQTYRDLAEGQDQISVFTSIEAAEEWLGARSPRELDEVRHSANTSRSTERRDGRNDGPMLPA